jgi:hypothetical protein
MAEISKTGVLEEPNLEYYLKPITLNIRMLCFMIFTDE